MTDPKKDPHPHLPGGTGTGPAGGEPVRPTTPARDPAAEAAALAAFEDREQRLAEVDLPQQEREAREAPHPPKPRDANPAPPPPPVSDRPPEDPHDPTQHNPPHNA